VSDSPLQKPWQQGFFVGLARAACARRRRAAAFGRHYVSARLVRETGVTMRALRACNWLYVRRKLIAAGEPDDECLPTHWSAEWAAQVLA